MRFIFNFLFRMISLEEQRVSVLILSYIIFVILTVIQLLKTNAIPSELTDILIWLAAFIAGYNGLQFVRNTNNTIQR